MIISLSDHFSYPRLLRFTMPAIFMVIFTSIYSVIDGLFVANFVGATPFAAVNIVWPFIMILGAVGFMLGSGGSALVAKTLGEQHLFKAKQIFSLLIYCIMFLGVVAAVLGLLFIEKILLFFGVNGSLLHECLIYADILFPAIPALMLQVIFQSFMSTAERPKLGLIITISAGVINFILDFLLIIVWPLGLAGAAWATAVSQVIGGFIPLIYFALPNKSLLHLGRTKLYGDALLKSATNGASEFLTHISMSLVGMVYNFQLLRMVGVAGVIAYGVISYVNFIFLAAFLGYGVGCNPIVGYHFGAGHKNELHNMWHKSLVLMAWGGVIVTILAELGAPIITAVFIRQDEMLSTMTVNGFQIYAISFLLAGFNIYASAFFTALNNGLVSATISFCRTMIFECLCVMILPLYFGLNGIWAAIIVAECLALIISITFFIKMRKRYGY